MDLLERYLQAVGQYLPEAARDDTLAELRANLLEQMDARSEELERPLETGDVAAILRSHGKPEAVALRYLPQRSLIGPTVFPFYMFTLRRAVPLVVLVYMVAQSANLFFTRADPNLADRIVAAALKLFPVLLVFAAIVTLTFVLVEYVISKGRLKDTLTQWDPAGLPPLKKYEDSETTKSTAKKIVELVLHCLWFAYVLWAPWHPYWILGPGVFFFDSLNVALAPVWHVFYVLLITLLSLQLIMRLLAFLPAARRLVQPMKFLTDLLGIVSIGWLAASSVYFVEAGTGTNATDVSTVNQAVGLAFKIAFLAALIGFGREVWKYAKRAKVTSQMAF